MHGIAEASCPQQQCKALLRLKACIKKSVKSKLIDMIQSLETQHLLVMPFMA